MTSYNLSFAENNNIKRIERLPLSEITDEDIQLLIDYIKDLDYQLEDVKSDRDRLSDTISDKDAEIDRLQDDLSLANREISKLENMIG